MPTARRAEPLSLRASRLVPGCAQPGEGRVMFSMGDPTLRSALLTRVADWFDKYTR